MLTCMHDKNDNAMNKDNEICNIKYDILNVTGGIYDTHSEVVRNCSLTDSGGTVSGLDLDSSVWSNSV